MLKAKKGEAAASSLLSLKFFPPSPTPQKHAKLSARLAAWNLVLPGLPARGHIWEKSNSQHCQDQNAWQKLVMLPPGKKGGIEPYAINAIITGKRETPWQTGSNRKILPRSPIYSQQKVTSHCSKKPEPDTQQRTDPNLVPWTTGHTTPTSRLCFSEHSLRIHSTKHSP